MTPEQRGFLDAARVARMATVDDAGVPTVLPICFHVDRSALYTVIDEKPKRVRDDQLRRVRNILANPAMAVVVDHWDEDWSRLGWVLLRGRGALLDPGPRHAAAIAALRAKYPQYNRMELDARLLIHMEITSVRSWGRLE